MAIINIKNTAGDWEEMPALQGNPDDFINLVYPVGSIYMSVNDVSPSTLFGGSWEKIEDTFLLASGSTFTLGSTGGEAEHTLTVDELPTHTHAYGYSIKTYYGYGGIGVNRIENDHASGNQPGDYVWEQGGGGNQPHNNMPPYLVVNIWKRIS